MNSKNFFVGFLISLTILMGVVVTTNLVVDVSGIYRAKGLAGQKFENNFAKRLSKTQIGLIKPSISERKIKLSLLQYQSADCYITGSSHEMGLSLGSAPQLRKHCSSLLNLASSGGSYEDAVIALHALSDQDEAMRIIGIGPWFFKRNTDTRWQVLGNAYQDARSYFLGGQTKAIQQSDSRLENLINGQYFIRNIESLFSEHPSLAIIEAHPENMSKDDAVIRPNGSLQYSKTFQKNTFPRQENIICNENGYKISKPYTDDSVTNEFRIIVMQTIASKKKVAFFLTPYHPGVFKCGGETVEAIAATETMARKLGAQLGVPVWGSFDPTVHGLRGNDFYDHMHMDHASLKKLVLD